MMILIRLLWLMWLLERPRVVADRETEESLIVMMIMMLIMMVMMMVMVAMMTVMMIMMVKNVIDDNDHDHDQDDHDESLGPPVAKTSAPVT